MSNNVNVKAIGFKTIGILLFVASGLITFFYMTSNVVGVIACLIAGIQALGIESAKSFFSYVFLTTNSQNMGKKISFGVLSVLAFVISIIATTGFSINMSYKVQDMLLKKSDDYKNSQKFLTTQNDLYEQTKKQIDDLKSQRDSQILKMEKVRDSWGKNYKTQKSLEQDKINATSAKYNQDILAKEQQLQAIATSLNTKTNESLKSEGFQGLYNVLAKYINDLKVESYETKQTTSEDISFWLNFAIAICLEFFGIGFIYLSMQEEGATQTIHIPNNNNNNIGFKPQNVIAQNIPDNTISSRKIGFEFEPQNGGDRKSEVQDELLKSNQEHFEPKQPETIVNTNVQSNINQDDLKVYLEYMYKHQRENISPGYMSIAKNTPLKIETCRKIKGHLERLGIIRTDGAKTMILQSDFQI